MFDEIVMVRLFVCDLFVVFVVAICVCVRYSQFRRALFRFSSKIIFIFLYKSIKIILPISHGTQHSLIDDGMNNLESNESK
jgi:hypothetical protein